MADHDLGRHLQSAAARPSGAAPVDAIRARARRRRRRRRAATALVPVVVVAAGVAAGVTAWPDERVELVPADPAPTVEPTPTPTPEPSPETVAAPTPTPTPDADDDAEAGDATVTVYVAREHAAGYTVEPEEVALDEPTVGVATAAMRELVAYEPSAPGRTTLAAEGAEVRGASIDGDVLTVDFSGLVGPQGLGSAQEMALVQQIAHTGAQFDNIRAVRILIDGRPVESLAGHVDLREPGEPSPLALSPITFTSHDHGETVDTGEVTVAGEACTYEATVELTLLAPDGSTAEDTFTTATSGCPERGTWQHTFTLDEPGVWTVRATEPDPSGGEGGPPYDVRLELSAS